MDTQTSLIIVSVSILVIVAGLIIFFRSEETKHLNRSVNATITQIKVEASTFGSWWTVIAQWSDPQSGQTLIFHSPHLKFPPKQHVGEPITVKFNAKQPKRYHMELHTNIGDT